MAKVALLIGVSEYQADFQPLAAATRDVEAVRQLLEHPEIGGFAPTDIVTLLNPEPQTMREKLVTLFRDRQKSDLLLLYFSGHGTTDDRGTFYLTCTNTKPELLEATAIPADFVHQLMENSRSKQQVIVLDCCFSGAFAKGMGVKGSAANLAEQLGGQGRAVLTSSSATEYSFEQKKTDLSVYTRYWVEGLQTGAADEDGDGLISVDELHNYTRRKVRESAPAMQPRIYVAEQGYQIILAKAPVGDPQLEYRKEVERLAQERKGTLSPILLDALNETRKQLALPVEIAQMIQDDVLKPYREFQRKVQRYELAVNSVLQDGLNQTLRDDLSYLQKALGLQDADVAAINRQLNSWNVSANQPAAQPRPVHGDVYRSQPTQDSVQLEDGSNQTSQNSKALILFGVGGIITIIIGAYTLPSLWEPNIQPSQKSSIQPSQNSPTITNQSKGADFSFSQGLAKYNKADYKGAIADYTEAIRLKPDYPDAYNNRGAAKSALGDKQGAIADYNNAIRLKPDYPEAYNNRGSAKDDLGDKQGAIADYTEAIRLKPDYASAYNNRGFAKYALDDKQGAIKDYNESIRLGSKDVHIDYTNRGSAKSAVGDKQGAIADYTEAIRLKPDYASAYYKRGLAKSALGDKQGAIADYQEAAKLYQQQGKTIDSQIALNHIKNLKQ